MDKNLPFDYRVVRLSENHFQIHKIWYDSNGNPANAEAEPVDISSASVENLTILLVHVMSALTKPPIDMGLFKKNPVESSTSDAMKIFKGL